MTLPNTFEGILIWAGALATFALYSLLYKENPVYRAAEHIFLGLATGYGGYVLWKEVLFVRWFLPLFKDGQWAWILALVAGGMFYTVYSPKLSWMSRLAMVTTMGLAAGLEFRRFYGQWIPQIGSSFKPLFVHKELEGGGTDLAATYFASFTNILFLVCFVCVLSYFFFSFRQQGKLITRITSSGRLLMMVAFGAMFGSTVMARMSLFIGRLDFLFREWIHWIR